MAGQVRQSHCFLGYTCALSEQCPCGRALSWIEPAHELVCRLEQEPTLTVLTNASLEKGTVKPRSRYHRSQSFGLRDCRGIRGHAQPVLI